MRLKLVSKGHGATTQLVDAETGRRIENAVAVEWSVSARGLARARVDFIMMPVDIEADFVVRKRRWLSFKIWLLGRWTALFG